MDRYFDECGPFGTIFQLRFRYTAGQDSFVPQGLKSFQSFIPHVACDRQAQQVDAQLREGFPGKEEVDCQISA